MHISIADQADADILQYLTQTTAFITAALAENEENSVLVRGLHSPFLQNGPSDRSPTGTLLSRRKP
jgi:hypothetical protein